MKLLSIFTLGMMLVAGPEVLSAGDCSNKKLECLLKQAKKDAQASANFDQGLREAVAFPDVPSAIGWTHDVGYQIQQQGFWDDNNPAQDFGNINGITKKLDYLADLGIKALWITQPTWGSSFFGFDTVDAKLIDPNTGTNDDFVRLIKEAHKRDMKIIMGSVWHQTSVLHPFFQKALQGDQDYMDRYYFETNPGQAFNEFFGDLWLKVKDYFPDSVLGQRQEDWYFRSAFGINSSIGNIPVGVADTNLENPVMIDWVVDFSKYWICKGIDGFRIDYAGGSQLSGFRNGEYVSSVDPNGHINEVIIRKLRAIKPDLFLYAESFFASLYSNGTINEFRAGEAFTNGKQFGGVTDYQLYALFCDLVNGVDPFGTFHPDTQNNGELFINEYCDKLLPHVSAFTDVTFLENHDLPRFMTKVTVTPSDQPQVTLTPPASYLPAPNGAFRIHYDASSLPPALTNNNMNLYYFNYTGLGASNPFPSGSVNNLAPPPGNTEFPFLGGGVDDFGPYWDFPLAYIEAAPPSGPVFGFIVIQTSGLVKVTENINIDTVMANIIVGAGKGDVFVSGVPVPLDFPTQDQLNQLQTFYGLLFALPGSPMLWQGQEQGMQGATSDSSREPLIWSSSGPQVTGFDPYNLPTGIAPPGYENLFSTQYTVRPPGSSNSLWAYLKDVIHVRNTSPSLKQGPLERLALPGNPSTDVVTIFDVGQGTVTARDLVAFTRSWYNWPVYCIFNFGETPKQVEVRGGQLVSCDVTFGSNVANLPPQIYYSHNITTSPVENPNCDPYIITMPQYSSVVFTPIQFFGIPNGEFFQNLPPCCS